MARRLGRQRRRAERGLRPACQGTDARAAGVTLRDWISVFKAAGRQTQSHNLSLIAQALAYNSFLAIPSVLLVTLGVFTLVAGPDTSTILVARLQTFMPHQATG